MCKQAALLQMYTKIGDGRMREILQKEYIYLDVDLHTREEVFHFISKESFKLGLAENQVAVGRSLAEREEQSSTGLLDGIAIPHAISADIKVPAILFIRIKEGVTDWQTIDNSQVKQVITMLVPKDGEQEHLQTLADLSGELVDEEQRKKLAACLSVDEVYDFLNQNDNSR